MRVTLALREVVMTKPLVAQAAEMRLRIIQSHLKVPETNRKTKSIELPVNDARHLFALIQTILRDHPIILSEEYLNPSEAARLAGVSRPVIVEMLKNKKLVGHKVGTHWRVKRDSLLAYIDNRDQASRAVSAMDEEGFGVD